MTQASTKNHYAKGLRYRQDIYAWIREIFVLFYGAFFLCSMVDKVFPGHAAIHYMFRFAFAIHPSALFFALGCIMGLYEKTGGDIRRFALKGALYSYLCFFVIGFVTEVFVTGHDVYTSIKDILIVVRVPDISSVFLSLCFLLLICAFFWDAITFILDHKPLLILVSLLGLVFLLLPEGFLGYGIIGTLIGSATTNCTPVIYYLFLFFAGILFARDPSKGVFHKKTLLVIAILFILSAVFAVLHMKHQAVVLFGIVSAYIFLLVSIICFPLYVKAEAGIISLAGKIKSAFHALMEKSKTSRPVNTLVYYSGYVLLFIVTAYLIFFPYLEEGRTLIWYVDGIGQYIPKAIRFMRCMPVILKELLHGNLNYQQYDFTTGLGSTFTVSHEPVYWLNLFFKPAQAELAYDIQILLRYFLSGISMSIMLRYFKKSFYASYLGSMAYAFCGYAIYTGTKHGLFLVPMILLPVLVVAMEELISKKKWYLLTVLTAISVLSSYYFLYMNTIALGIYFIVRILCTKEYRNIKTFFTRGLIITGSYLIGAAIGSVTLFNSFGGYVGSSRSSGGSVSSFLSTTPLFYRPLWLSDFFIGFLSDYYSPGLWLRIGLAPLALLAIILVFTRVRKKEIKPIFLLLTLFCIIPVFGYVLNGFSNVSNRWCYIYIVALIFILAEYLDDFRSLTNIEIGLMCAVTAFYGLIIFFTQKHRTDTGLGAFSLLVITLLTLLILNNDRFHISKKAGQRAILTITLLSVILNANMYITNTRGEVPHLDNYVKKGTSMAKMSATALKYLDEATKDEEGQEDKGFYRSTNLYTYGNTRSSSLVYGYNDISVFNSTLNGGIVAYNNLMGNSDYNIVSIYSYNFRTIMDELASVRYLGGDSSKKIPVPYGYRKIFKKKETATTYSIYENDYTLPIGYTYSSVFSDEEADKLSAAEKQELTLISAIVDDEMVEEDKNIGVNTKPDLTVHKLKVDSTELDNVTMEKGIITIGEGGGSITFHFEGEPNSETYVAFKGDILFPLDGAEHFINCKVLADGVDYIHKFRVDAYSTGQEEYLLNLGYHKDPTSSCTLLFQDPGQLEYEDISIISQSMDSYPDRANALREEALENVKVETNTVTGTINTTKDKMLVFSLPYQSGWTAYVDGKKTSLQRVNYQYMGINLPAGKHDIRLQYRLPGQKATFICTTGGLLVFALIILFNFIRKKLRRKQA